MKKQKSLFTKNQFKKILELLAKEKKEFEVSPCNKSSKKYEYSLSSIYDFIDRGAYCNIERRYIYISKGKDDYCFIREKEQIPFVIEDLQQIAKRAKKVISYLKQVQFCIDSY